MTNDKALSLDAEQVTAENYLAVVEALHGEKLTREECGIRYARRILALKKNEARKASGKRAARFYRGDERALPKDMREKVGAALERVDTARETDTTPPAPKVASKPAPSAKPAPRAKGPTVRKPATKVKPAEGGAAESAPL